MTGHAVCKMMPDGKRLHLQHGPIDIICEAFGDRDEIERSYQQARNFFETVLQSLVDDLAVLKKPLLTNSGSPLNPISQRMHQTALKFSKDHFLTSMAAVAGSVAEAVLESMLKARNLSKVYVNNGGDIAFWLNADEVFRAGVVENQDTPSIGARIEIRSNDKIGGIATSGWRGRSLSMGIADAVTVLANCAPNADVAATLIAGDVFVDDPAVVQKPAYDIDANTDLGELLVTTEVGQLMQNAKNVALDRGERTAHKFLSAGLISSAYIVLQGEVREISLPKLVKNEEKICLSS